jgi:GT2 family glycosyltransferase
MRKVSIVILNFNGWKDTIECIESIRKISIPKDIKIETVVIDNASINDSVDEIKKVINNEILIVNKANLGFAAGNNVGIRHALETGADYIMLLNNDTLVHRDLIKELVLILEDEGIGGVVPKIYFAKGYEFQKRYKNSELGKVIWYAGGKMDWENLIGKNIGVDEVDHGQFNERTDTELATGCCFLIRSDVLRKIGLFDEKYFLYYEDADLSERIKKAGYKIAYQPKAVLWHKNAGSSGGSGSALQDYYITRNRLLFGMKYAPYRTRLALIKESFKILITGRIWQKNGVRDYYLRRFFKGSFIF